MTHYLPTLRHSPLFAGISESEIETMLSCLGAVTRSYSKGDFVYRAGERPTTLNVLMKGKLYIQSDDYWGNRHILHIVESGDLFGEAYVAPDSGALMSDVIAAEDSTVMALNLRRLLTTCSVSCCFHAQVIQNLVFTLSAKNRRLVGKLGILSKRSTREKLIAYLSEEAKKHDSAAFTIPFNRQQLADFLSVDRSAMSKELCRMRDDGMLEFHKNRFILH